MKRSLQITHILLISLLFFTIIHATGDEETKKAPLITNSPSSPQTYGNYFKAMFQANEGKVDQAQIAFKNLNMATAPAAMQRGYIQFLRSTRQYTKILEQLSLLDKHFSDNPEVQITIIEAYLNTNQKQLAGQRILKAIDQFPNHQGIAMFAAQWYVDNKNPENALTVIDRYLSEAPSKPNNYIFLFIKTQILAFQNKKEQALAALKECLATYRNFEKGWLLYALLEEQLGNLEEAIKGYSTFLDIVGREPSVQNHLMELLFKRKMIKENKTALTIPMFCLQKALLFFEQNQPAEALKQIEECIKQEPKNNDARLLKIQILENLGSIQQAFNLLIEWMNGEPDNELWFKTSSLLHKKGIKRHDLAAAFQAVEKKNPRSLLPLEYLADLYLRANNQQEALVYLQKVIDVTTNSLLKAKACYQKARIFHQQHNIQAMVKELEAGRAACTAFAPLNNMLAYYYGSKGNNHSKAQELIKQSLANDPQNPHYLDTLGYISYRHGDLQEALKIIEPLASRIPDDTVIENHMRKIHQGLAHKGTVGGSIINK